MIHDKLSITDYHSHEALGSTDLKRALRSVSHMRAGRETERALSKALKIGSAAHCHILEPHLFNQSFYMLPEFKGVGSKLRREEYVSSRGQAECLTKGEWLQVMSMGRAVRAHPMAQRLLASGLAERSHFWIDPDSGISLKCRPDFYSDDGYIVDLKTTQDASPESFRKSIANYQYHLQAALYIDGIIAQGLPANDVGFIFVAVESERPHAVGVYILDQVSIDEGRKLYKRALRKILEASKRVKSEGYSEKLIQLSLPPWAFTLEE